MKKIKIKQTFNACGGFCAYGLFAKIGVPFPAQLPTVLETLRPNSVSHVSSFGCDRGHCLWHRKGAHKARLGQTTFSVSSTKINVPPAQEAAERILKKDKKCGLLS